MYGPTFNDNTLAVYTAAKSATTDDDIVGD
jgi:hypothetical protein